MTFRSFRKTMGKKQRSFASRSSSSSRPGLERAVSQADQTVSSADGPDDDVASALSRSSSGVSACAEAPRFPSIAHTEHRVRRPRRATQRSTPARPLTRDLAGKYGDLAVSQVILGGSNSADGQNPPSGDSTLGKLSSG